MYYPTSRARRLDIEICPVGPTPTVRGWTVSLGQIGPERHMRPKAPYQSKNTVGQRFASRHQSAVHHPRPCAPAVAHAALARSGDFGFPVSDTTQSESTRRRHKLVNLPERRFRKSLTPPVRIGVLVLHPEPCAPVPLQYQPNHLHFSLFAPHGYFLPKSSPNGTCGQHRTWSLIEGVGDRRAHHG